jgi:uncharacterized membrane protein/Mg-chelatase subunit ChlD
VTVTFDNPRALLLLILLPIFYLVGRFGVAYISRPVRTAAIAIRLVIAACLILAISEPVVHRNSDQLSVLYLVDRSASVEVNGSSAANSWLDQALAAAGPNDRTGVIDFASNAVVRRGLGSDQSLGVTTPIDPSQSNLASALHLATTLFPAEGARRIIVLSDGQTNVGNSVSEARLDSTRQVHVDVVPIGPPPGFREVWIDSFVAPPAVRVGQGFDISAVVQSTVAGDASLRFLMDGQQISQGTVHLRGGANRFSINLASAPKGFHRLEADVSSPNDTYIQNNQMFSFTVVEDTGSIAVVTATPSDASALVSALQASQIKITMLGPAAIPSNLNALKQYDGMVIVNTPATAFTLDQTKAVAAFVHDLGRGLTVIGGPEGYGQGKYDGTPLGDALPVASGVPGNVDAGSVALVLVIDKSGSMDEDQGGVRKMTMADRAAQLAIGLLAPNDDVGVEAFDTQGTWVLPVQKIGSTAHQKSMEDTVGQISASGGTDIFEALGEAYTAIHPSKATYKHIILMSDGNSLTESDYTPLLQHIQDERITLSTIAIGSDADQKLMQMLAQKGNGSYYYTDDANKIPEITTRETKVVRGSAKVDASFQPLIVAPSPLLESFVGRDLPQLGGYVVTTPKRNATVALDSDRKDPVLAHWNYGLGRVVAWTSDLTTTWSKGWLGWSDFGRFWSQTVNWSMRPPGNPNLQMSYSTSGGEVDFKVDAVSDSGIFQDLLDLRARVAGQDGQPIEVPLVQTRPGRYEARFSMNKPGAYPVDVVQYDTRGQVNQTETTGVVVPYPDEYRSFGVNDSNLVSIAAATGGRVVTSPLDSYSREGLDFVGAQSLPLWQLLLALAAILFPLDVAIRRLRIEPIDLIGRGIRAAGARLLALRRPPSEVQAG